MNGGFFPLESLEALEGAKEHAQSGHFPDAEWTSGFTECKEFQNPTMLSKSCFFASKSLGQG
jgi:hypothetical protein